MSEEAMDVNVQNDSSSTSDSDDNTDDELTNRAAELERQLNSNKYLYDVHLEVVDIYRKLGDLNSMRAAYDRFHKCFPLTPKIWLEWIRDEIKISSTPEEQRRLFNLFDKAVEDYLCVELWIEYAQYSIGVSDVETTRSILERGLTAAGRHTSQGSLLWDTLRELEHAHLSLAPKESEEWKVQVNRLAEGWFSTLPEGLVDPNSIEWAYNNALKNLETYKPFEDRLLTANGDEEVYDIYKQYIKAVKDPSTILCLYERAATILCLFPNLWLDYCIYAFNLGEAALNISARALRNCPWNEELWVTKIRIMEKLSKDEKEVLDYFEQGIQSISPAPGLELWLTYLEYVHRNSKDVEKLDKLFSQAIQQFTFEKDPCCKLSRLHARLLAKRGDIHTAHKIWGKILHQAENKGTASVWLEYCNLDRQYGDATHLRSLFQRALSACKDWPQYIAEEWLMFERENGVTTQVQQQTVGEEGSTRGNKRKNDSKDIEDYKKKKRRSINAKEGPISTKGEDSEPFKNKFLEKDPKKTVFISNLHPSVDEDKLKELFPNSTGIELVRDRKGKSRCYGFVQFLKEEEAMTALARDRLPLDGRPVFISELKPDKTERKSEFKYATNTETNKLFVRGLPKTKTKDDVEELFKMYNPTDVRLVLHKNGQPKGLAYCPPRKKAFERIAEPVRHARSRLQVPLIPRSLQVKGVESKEKEANIENGSGGASVGAPKSNADFRKMLLKK
ncbi:hypothetical protein NQ317_001443 [Molorchus minor]|uniref:RRM domain-containing protein n=1 Tax=Molorchus minor TaxID=1323400 RepID=A0ABQ9JM54_9CUCU|nr:hypothetical protein NQ317_001443 [Molorchus minor]